MSEQPKKWKRASAPKVRTGCLTCKIRHLKCDEHKPTCQRCEKDRVKCDGYPANPPPRPKKEPRPSQRCKALTAPAKTNMGRLLLNSGLGGNISTLPFQIDLFHHFRTSTLHDLNMVPGSPSDFWHVHVLPLGHAVEPVKHALCALGGVHRYFKTQHGNPNAMAEWRELDKIVIQQYNQAIHHIKSLMSDASESNLEVVLTCCIIFICIENLQGRYKEALRHIRAGSALLSALRQSYVDPGSPSDSGSSPASSSASSPTPSRRVPKFVDEIGEMLFNLGQDVSFYVGAEIIPTLTCRDINTLPEQYSAAVQFPSAPISSFGMADSSLRAMEVMDNTIRYHLFEENPRCDPKQRDWEEMFRNPNAYEQMLWDAFEQTMQDWISRFDSFRNQMDQSRITEREREHLQSLSLSRAVWWSFLNHEGPEDQMPRKEAEEILNSVESIMGPTKPDKQPTFTFSAEIVPATCVVCMSCPERDIQLRAVRLLRTMKRREGMWDSEELANVFEAMLVASKKGLMDFQDIPCEIPHLTRALSALSVTETPLPREIINLEEEQFAK